MFSLSVVLTGVTLLCIIRFSQVNYGIIFMYHDMPRTAAEAYEQGVKYFFTGKLCVRGHGALRYRANGQCVDCTIQDKKRERTGPWHKANQQGDMFYDGCKCKICGTTRKYTKSRLCHHCSTHTMTPHEIQFLVIRYPSKPITWYEKKANRNSAAIYDAFRALNIPRRGKPQHYAG